jgi:hypothetical protein
MSLSRSISVCRPMPSSMQNMPLVVMVPAASLAYGELPSSATSEPIALFQCWIDAKILLTQSDINNSESSGENYQYP